MREHRRLHCLIAFRQPGLRQPHGRRAHVARRVVECGEHELWLQLVHPVERPERVEAGPHVGRTGGQLGQRRNDRDVLALDEEALRCIAAPSVRVRQRLDERRRCCRRQRRLLVALGRIVDDAIDSSPRDRLLEPVRHDVIAQVFGDESPVLDDAAVHVDEIQRPVRRIREEHGAKSLVGRREELRSLVGLLRLQRRSRRR